MDNSDYRILIIEDNEGDFVLIEEYLNEFIYLPIIDHAETFKDGLIFLQQSKIAYDIILLDLSLPDKSGRTLVNEFLSLNINIPIIILTGFGDVEFSIESIKLGIYDYLLKDGLTSALLYKSISYALERKKRNFELQSSEKRYKDIFQLNPQPMWIYDTQSLQFLDINPAAINHYGYSKEEFLSITIRDILLEEDLQIFDEVTNSVRFDPDIDDKIILRHQKKNHEVISVEIYSCAISVNGQNCRLVNVHDVTERIKFLNEIEEQNKNLREIAWLQSHVVRAPLSRILGLIELIKIADDFSDENKKIINFLLISANELDDVIKEITHLVYKK